MTLWEAEPSSMWEGAMEGDGDNLGQWWQVSATVKGTGDGANRMEAARMENRRWMPEIKTAQEHQQDLARHRLWMSRERNVRGESKPGLGACANRRLVPLYI